MKILMIGLGGIGQRHLRNLRSLLGADAEFLAVRHLNRPQVLTEQLKVEADSGLIDKYQIQVCPTLEDALEQKPEVAFICNPTSLHVSSALKAAEAGCHLFIEKPLAHNFENVDQLVHVVEERRLRAMVGYQMRFHPCLIRLRELLEEQAIGRIISVRAEVGDYMPGWHSYEDYRQLYASRSDLGGGVILTQIHEFDYLLWLFGAPQRVFAIGGRLSSLEIDVEDSVDVLMDSSASGVLVPVSLHLDFVQRPSTRTCVVTGEQGKIIADIKSLTVRVYDSSGTLVENVSYEGYDRNEAFLQELKHFFGLEEHDPACLVDLREAARGLKVALGARESLQTGRQVDFK